MYIFTEAALNTGPVSVGDAYCRRCFCRASPLFLEVLTVAFPSLRAQMLKLSTFCWHFHRRIYFYLLGIGHFEQLLLWQDEANLVLPYWEALNWLWESLATGGKNKMGEIRISRNVE